MAGWRIGTAAVLAVLLVTGAMQAAHAQAAVPTNPPAAASFQTITDKLQAQPGFIDL